MNLKLSKSHAERALRAVSGSAAGMEVIRDSEQYAAARGLTTYWIKLFDNWPDKNLIRVDMFFSGQAIKTVLIDPETFKPDWAATNREERRKIREEQL